MTRKEIAPILIGLMVAMFPGALDTTIMGPAMPTIGRELGDVANLPWIVTSYLLVSTAATPLYGKLSDIHGRRIMLQVAIATFAVGSVFCALAPTMILLALARALQAVGGGGLVSLIFWINLPLCLAAYLMTDRKLKTLPRHERPHKLDFIGAVLLVIASVLFQLFLSWGGTRYPWGSSIILMLGAASIGFTALLVLRLNTADEPLIPYSLMRNPVVLIGSSAVGVTMGVFVGLMIYVPIYFESIRNISATYSGLSLLPLTICTTIGAVAAGRGMSRLEHYKVVPLVGLVIAALGLLPIFFWPVDLSILSVEILLGIVATGVGAVFPVTTVSVQNSVGRHDLGTATSLVTFMRNLGAAAGVAIFGTIAIGGATVAPDLGHHVQLSPDVVDRFRWIFLVGAVGFVIAFVTLLQMEERPLSVRQQTRPFK